MNMNFLKGEAGEVLEKGLGEAKEFLEDGGKMDQLLSQAEEKLESIPIAGKYFAEVPRMIAMVKDYVENDYREVPVKSVLFIVAALLYLVNPKDLIPDWKLGIGQLDDAAVIAACIALTKTDLDAYDAWKENKVTIV